MGPKVLITGADSGMGRAAAIAFARKGTDVAISHYPTEEPDAREVVQLIKAKGRKATPIPGDLRQESYCGDLVNKAIAEPSGIDIIVSNAGRQQKCEDLLLLTTEAFDATININIYAPFGIIKTALPHLQPGSCIISTTSEQPYDPAASLYDYAHTKAATMNNVKSLAQQFGLKRIRVNGVVPAPIWTPLQVSTSGLRRSSYSGLRASMICEKGASPYALLVVDSVSSVALREPEHNASGKTKAVL